MAAEGRMIVYYHTKSSIYAVMDDGQCATVMDLKGAKFNKHPAQGGQLLGGVINIDQPPMLIEPGHHLVFEIGTKEPHSRFFSDEVTCLEDAPSLSVRPRSASLPANGAVSLPPDFFPGLRSEIPSFDDD